jgi:ketosteroid isomerase-like protein
MVRHIALALLGSFLLAGCQQAAAPADTTAAAITEAEASKVFDGTVAAWQSMDPAKVKAIYAPDVAGFDYSAPGLVSDRATWDKNQDAFAAAKLDSVKVSDKKIQILDGDNFIVTSLSQGTSTATPANNTTFRCTDVYHRQAGGEFAIVNEHCSGPPQDA